MWVGHWAVLQYFVAQVAAASVTSETPVPMEGLAYQLLVAAEDLVVQAKVEDLVLA